MSEARKTFLTESTLTKLISANELEDLTLGMMMLIHKNRGVAEVRARRFRLESGENRTVLKDYELEELEGNGELNPLSPDQDIRISLTTGGDFKILSNYINTGEETPVKSIIVKLMSGGVLYDILPFLTIKRPDILFKINQYYDSIIPEINNEFSRFLFKYPSIEKKINNRSDLYFTKRTQFFIDMYKNTIDKKGEKPTPEEVKQFGIDLGEMRSNLINLYEPPISKLTSWFGFTNTTYFNNVRRAQNELGQLLAKK